jgi:hypothetical protein
MSDDIIKFYVYVYYDPRTGEPFYVGKGSGPRYKKHLTNARNQYLKNKINKIRSEGFEPVVEKVFETSVEDDAYDYEETLIKIYKPKHEGGVLCNLTYGTRGGIKYDFDEAFYDRLGTTHDGNIAKDYGCSTELVCLIRNDLGIQNFKGSGKYSPPNKKHLPQSGIDRLGKESDYKIAKDFDISPQTVGRIREELGIPPRYGKKGQIKKFADSNTYVFINKHTKEKFVGSRHCFCDKIKVTNSYLGNLIRGRYKSIKGGLTCEGVYNE